MRGDYVSQYAITFADGRTLCFEEFVPLFGLTRGRAHAEETILRTLLMCADDNTLSNLLGHPEHSWGDSGCVWCAPRIDGTRPAATPPFDLVAHSTPGYGSGELVPA